MIEFASSDFRVMNTFELSWRWTKPKWKVLPEAVLAQIHPLTKAKANELWPYAQRCGNELYPYAFQQRQKDSSPHFMIESIRSFDAAKEREAVRVWLHLLQLQEEQTVIVMWDQTIAVIVSWSLFCDYWDDFCYPASDDVFVWPISQAWFLLYFHEEQFLFGQCKSRE